MLSLLVTPPAWAATVALVLAVDVSESVTAAHYELQHEGIARAFETQRLLDAIASQAGGIEATVIEWSDADKIVTAVPWTRIADAAAGRAFAQKIRATERSSAGVTAIGPALLAAGAAFTTLPEPAERHVIDLSGDGMANFGPPPATIRDLLVAQGITINGLAILTEEPWLQFYYRNNVIGGDAAFVVEATDFDSFADAVLSKLVQEVAGNAAAPRDSIGVLKPFQPKPGLDDASPGNRLAAALPPPTDPVGSTGARRSRSGSARTR